MCCLKEIVKREHRKALTQYERFVDQHKNNVRSTRRRATTTTKAAAAVEARVQAVYAWGSSLNQKEGERSKRFRERVSAEPRAVEIG